MLNQAGNEPLLMNIERLKNSREFEYKYPIRGGCDQIVMFYKELPEFRITFWDYYFHQIFDQAKYHYLEWTDFTRDYHACQRTLYFGKEPVAIGDLDEYLNDLYSYNDKMEKYDNPESRECYELVCGFLAYTKETGMTVMVDEE